MQDEQLIETLFHRHYERMLLTARTLLRDPEEARDVVSDVFAELIENDRRLDPERTESYLLVSVRNKCLNLVKHRMMAERVQELMFRDSIDDGYTELPLDDILHYIKCNLTPRSREVMLRRYDKNQKYEEIADGLGISRIAVYKHIAQSLTKLKKHFVWKS